MVKTKHLEKSIDELILSTLSKKAIIEQQQLLDILRTYGVQLTQSSLSRKLKKMSIFKVNGRYKAPSKNSSLQQNLLHIYIQYPCTIIIHTTPGTAASTAWNLDQHLDFKPYNPDLKKRINGILGTIAGDDTIFVAVSNDQPIEKVKKKIEQFLLTKEL